MAQKDIQVSKRKSILVKYENNIRHFINHKCLCLASRKAHVIAPLGTVTANAPMDIIAIDFLKVDRPAGGYEYILVVIDPSTRYAQVYATTNKSAKTVAQKIFNDFVSKFGIPNAILHDQGKELENRLFDELQNAERLHIIHSSMEW